MSVIGGRYIVGGVLVDANGAPIEAQAVFDVEAANRDELIAESQRRGLTVVRADGDTDKRPTVDDYRAALRAADDAAGTE